MSSLNFIKKCPLVIAFLFTALLTIHTIITHHRSNPFSATGKLYTVLRVALEILTLLLWIATAGLMLRPKAGCEEEVKYKGLDACGDGSGNFRAYRNERPNISWDLGIAFSFVEMYVVPALVLPLVAI